MACNEYPSSIKQRQIFNRIKKDINKAQEVTNKLQKEKENLETALRALCAELDRRGIAAEVVSTAQHSGLIGLLGFWNKNEDLKLNGFVEAQ